MAIAINNVLDLETVKIWGFAFICNIIANTDVSNLIITNTVMTDKEFLELAKLYLSCFSIACACLYSISKTIMLYREKKEKKKDEQFKNDNTN